MTSSVDLRIAKQEMDRLWLAYLQDEFKDAELRKKHIDSLTRATIQFLKLREESDRGRV